MAFIRDLTEKTCQSIDIHNPIRTGGDLDKYTLEEWARQQGASETGMASVRVWTRAMLGVEPSDLSALYFMDYCKSGGGLMQMRSDKKNGGQYFRLTHGMFLLPAFLISFSEAHITTNRNPINFRGSNTLVSSRISYLELASPLYRADSRRYSCLGWPW